MLRPAQRSGARRAGYQEKKQAGVTREKAGARRARSGGTATASSQQDFDEAAIANDADVDNAARVDPKRLALQWRWVFPEPRNYWANNDGKITKPHERAAALGLWPAPPAAWIQIPPGGGEPPTRARMHATVRSPARLLRGHPHSSL